LEDGGGVEEELVVGVGGEVVWLAVGEERGHDVQVGEVVGCRGGGLRVGWGGGFAAEPACLLLLWLWLWLWWCLGEDARSLSGALGQAAAVFHDKVHFVYLFDRARGRDA
jgi:hypothetical protein